MQQVGSARVAEVLLAEDNEDDVLITQKGLLRAKLKINLHHVENGQQCMQFLRKESPYNDAPTPDLILLDLNMPIMNGYEVLREIVADDRLRKLPVVVLTTSTTEQDLLEMYDLRCSSYIVKPVDFVKFQEVICEISNYWFTVVVLPPSDDT